MDIKDPGLFDTPLPQKNEDVPIKSPEEHRNTRRVYRPVPEEKRNSKEYRVVRERNNKAVKRCRANNRVKQDCLAIKSEGYLALAEQYDKATKRIDEQRKALEQLFPRYLMDRSGLRREQCHALLAQEQADRLAFDVQLESTRRAYAERVQVLTAGGATKTSAPPTPVFPPPPSSSSQSFGGGS